MFSACHDPETMFSDRAATRSNSLRPSLSSAMHFARVAASFELVIFASRTSMFTFSSPSTSANRRRLSSLP